MNAGGDNRRVKLAAAGLGLAYAVSAVILLLVEPRMGFRHMLDFWNPELVVPALSSTAWLVSDLCHLASGVLLLVLADSPAAAAPCGTSRLVSIFGQVAGAVFVLLAMIDRAGAWLPSMVVGPQMLDTLAVGFIATRLGVLFAALFFLGGFIALTAWHGRRALPAWFLVLSVIVAAAALVFAIVPMPIPVALAIWAFALAWVWPSMQPVDEPINGNQDADSDVETK